MTALRDRGVAAPTLDHPVDHAGLRVTAERQRIGGALHDEVGQLLFAMASRARRSYERDSGDPAALHDTLGLLLDQLEQTQSRLRAVIGACGPETAADTLPAATQRDLDDFADRTGAAAHLLVLGRAEYLPPAVERVALSCVRQALFNIERHAAARLVVVTVEYRGDRLRLVVQDDGRGLPADFEPRAVPLGGHNWGFTSMAEQVERLGGMVELRRADEGGTQLLVELPRPLGAR
ncbi:MAG TPA: ATP-binding protein [Pseudonocardia sp.]|jgi:signal transduction histidine kinase